jgi:hypothetical protein
VALLAGVVCEWHGFKTGQVYVNHWLVISAYNDGYKTGNEDGFMRCFSLLLQDSSRDYNLKKMNEDYKKRNK